MAIDKNKTVESAQKYAARGQIERAIEEWQKLLTLTPNDGNIYNTIGDLYLKKNLAKEAIEQYLKAADAFNQAGFALKTIAVYKKILKLSPDRTDTYLRLADLNAERGLTSNAIEDYLRVARQYTKNGLIKDTLDIYKKIAGLDPTNLNIRLKLAEIYLKEGLKNEAAKEFLEIADIYFYKEQLKEAQEFYGQVLKIDPSNSLALKGQEKIRFATKKPDINTLLSEADSHIQSGRFNEAEAIITELTKKDTHNPAYHQRLGYIYLGRSKFEDAFSEFKPIAEEYIRNDEFEKAEKIILDYLKADSNRVDAMMLLADIYEKSGNLDLAVSEYAKVIEYYLDKGSLAEASLVNPIYQKIKELEPDSKEVERFRKIFEPAEVKTEKPEVKEGAFVAEPEAETIQPGEETVTAEEPVASSGTEAKDVQVSEKIEAYFTEAEVYMKYGLTKNAIEQLKAVADLEPNNIRAHNQLKEIYRLEGDIEKTVSECIILSKIYDDSDDFAGKISILDEAQRLDPDNKLVKEAMGKTEIKGEIPETVFEKIETETVQPAIEPNELKLGEETPSGLETSGNEAIEIDEKGKEALSNLKEDLAEAEFYLQQGIIEEAKKIYQEIITKYPDSEEAKAKLAELEVETEIEKGFREVSATNEHNVDMEAMPEGAPEEPIVIDKTIEEAIPEAIPKEEAAPKVEEEEYFDLSEALKEDLTTEKKEEPESKVLNEELESIFQDFQKGVQEQFSEEDYETHYNLGIAYKEMGLINEAIGEFQLSIKGPDRFIDSVSMLATCFQEKGMYKSAITQLDKALSDPRCDEKRSLFLKYDLGLLYEMANMPEKALEIMSEVYSVDINFRDVAKKIEELKTQVMVVGKETISGVTGKKEIGKAEAAKKKGKISYL